MTCVPSPKAFEVEDDCEFVPYFDEDQVQRRLDEVPEENRGKVSMVENWESLKLFEIYGSHLWKLQRCIPGRIRLQFIGSGIK